MSKLSRKTCTVDGCTRKHYAKGLCRNHRLIEVGERCAIAGCEAIRYSKGMCRRHYELVGRYGSPTPTYSNVDDLPGEVWQPVPGWEAFYSVSDLGRVKSHPRSVTNSLGITKQFAPRILKSQPDAGGYLWLSLHDKPKLRRAKIHHLVLEAFIGPRPRRMVTNHKNGDKLDNRLENLEYVTSSRNNTHALRKGLRSPARGERQGKAKLTEDQVRYVRAMRGQKSHSALAKELGVAKSTIGHIQLRLTWRHLD